MADEAQPNNAATMPPTGPPPVDVTPATSTHGGRYVQYKVSHNNTFEVTAKYKPPIEQAGSGAYGFVCSFFNSETNQKVAIKKIPHAFDVRSDAKKTLREIKLLSHMDHENIIAIRDIIPPPQRETMFNDVYIVYELMETDLHRVIHSNETLTSEHIQYFMYQILRGLKYIHSANVLHRDLKPSNILVNINCEVKICDFGLARVSSDTEFMSDYVVTRWYRPPELLLKSLGSYNWAIDVWSVGCIFMELMNRKPLFPGRDPSQQMRMIFQLLGTPSEDEISHMSENAKKYIGQLPIYKKQAFLEKFPRLNPLAVDLVEKMLAFDPKMRITVVDALAHPFFGVLRDESDEPVCSNPFTVDVDWLGLNEEQMKDVIYHESLRYNPNHHQLSCE